MNHVPKQNAVKQEKAKEYGNNAFVQNMVVIGRLAIGALISPVGDQVFQVCQEWHRGFAYNALGHDGCPLSLQVNGKQIGPDFCVVGLWVGATFQVEPPMGLIGTDKFVD